MSRQPAQVSAAARRLAARAHTVFDRWEARARQSLAGAAETPPLVLRDYLIGFIDHAVQALEAQANGQPPPATDEFLANAGVHGRLRAAVPDFDIGQVITEYRLLRQCILEALGPESLTPKERDLLTRLSEDHITAAACAYTESIRELQQHAVRTVSHDLRSPLAVLRLSLQLAQRAAGDAEARDAHIARAMKVVASLDRITEGALAVAAFQAGQGLNAEFAELDLVAVARQVYETAHATYGEAIKLRVPELPVLGRFSASACERALENLLDNALKYGDRERDITLVLSADAVCAYLQVHNWGEPIPEADRSRVFNAFSRGHSAQEKGAVQGWGLGLALVAAVARAHGGRASFSSDHESGTAFTLALPRSGPGEGVSKRHLLT